jgi:hypothetical protein
MVEVLRGVYRLGPGPSWAPSEDAALAAIVVHLPRFHDTSTIRERPGRDIRRFHRHYQSPFFRMTHVVIDR